MLIPFGIVQEEESARGAQEAVALEDGAHQDYRSSPIGQAALAQTKVPLVCLCGVYGGKLQYHSTSPIWKATIAQSQMVLV